MSKQRQKGRKRSRNRLRTLSQCVDILTGLLSNQTNILNVAGVSEKCRRIFSKHNILVHFKPNSLAHPKDRTAPQTRGSTKESKLFRTRQLCTYTLWIRDTLLFSYFGQQRQSLRGEEGQHLCQTRRNNYKQRTGTQI